MNQRLNHRHEKSSKQLILAPLFVSLGAALWATDTFFRSHLANKYNAIFVVTVTHCLCLVVTLPLFATQFAKLKSFRKSDWLAVLFIAIGGSVLAMTFFTLAFASTKNYNIPILLQKLQPLIAIGLARLLLKEQVSRYFIPLAFLSLVGAYLISFGDLEILKSISDTRFETVIYTLLAAAIWGSCTVASRHLLKKESFLLITASRYIFATVLLLILTLSLGYSSQVQMIDSFDLKYFALMALFPGLVALLIYYYGVESTSASVATLCELSFPLGAVAINWLFLDSPLSSSQILGTILLLASVTAINLKEQKT